MSYCCDRARSITWGIEGGLPSIPHGVWLTREGEDEASSSARRSPTSASARATCSRGRRPAAAASATRSSATPRRWSRTSPTATSRSSARASTTASSSSEVDAELAEYELDEEATEKERKRIRGERAGWLEDDAEQVAERYREGELDTMDAIRRHGVILDWGTGELLERTTEQFRAMLKRRAVDHWETG